MLSRKDWAKAVYLQSLLGDSSARAKALELADEAIKRGGVSSWFNRLRASVNRVRTKGSRAQVPANEYARAVVRSFDDHLEKLGTKGSKFDGFCNRITECLNSEKHEEYCEGLEKLGNLLGYQATRPKYRSATDNRWRGTFGNTKELITIEAKIEQTPTSEVVPTYVGQAHNQLNRAVSEFGHLGYSIRGIIVTHLTAIDPAAKSSAGAIRIVAKSAIYGLWEKTHGLLSVYRQGWSLDDIPARLAMAAAIIPKCPRTGWLLEALDDDILVLDTKKLVSHWSK